MGRYRRLTKSELDAVGSEFVQHLAAEGIDAMDWQKKLRDDPAFVETCLDAFSERFWDGATAAIEYLEHHPSEGEAWFFYFEESSGRAIRSAKNETQVTWSEGVKEFEPEGRGREIFLLLEQGAQPCSKDRFDAVTVEMNRP